MSYQQLESIVEEEVIANIKVELAMAKAENHKVGHKREEVRDFSNSFVKELGQTNEAKSYGNFRTSFDQTLVEWEAVACTMTDFHQGSLFVLNILSVLSLTLG